MSGAISGQHGIELDPADGEEHWEAQLAEARANVPPGGVLRLVPVGGWQQASRSVLCQRLVRAIEEGFAPSDGEQGGFTLRRRPLRILYLAPWVTVGGSDRATVDWFRRISAEHFRKFLITTQEGDNPLFGEAEAHADEAWCLPELMPGPSMPAFISQFIATREADAVHIMNSKLGFDLLPALRVAHPRLRVVVQLHAEEPGGGGYPSYVTARFDEHVDGYSVVSDQLGRRIGEYGVDASKIWTIHLGVDAEVFDPDRAGPTASAAGEARLDILFPHRLVDQKDPLLMVSVAAALRDAGSTAVVHIVGDGERRAEVEAAVAAAGLQGRVVLHGAQSDMTAWYRANDVVLLTSRYEGVPLVVYEAMSMGRPVVAADVGATSEVLDDRCGYLVQPRHSVDAYVRALLRLERDGKLRQAMGSEGRRKILAGFTLDDMAVKHELLYRSLMARLLVGPPR